MLPKCLISIEKDALFRVIEDPRDRAILRLAYHHGLSASEIGTIHAKDWRRGTSFDMDRLFLRRLEGSIGGETILVNAAATALRAWLRIRGTSPGPIFTSKNRRRIAPTSRSLARSAPAAPTRSANERQNQWA